MTCQVKTDRANAPLSKQLPHALTAELLTTLTSCVWFIHRDFFVGTGVTSHAQKCEGVQSFPI